MNPKELSDTFKVSPDTLNKLWAAGCPHKVLATHGTKERKMILRDADPSEVYRFVRDHPDVIGTKARNRFLRNGGQYEMDPPPAAPPAAQNGAGFREKLLKLLQKAEAPSNAALKKAYDEGYQAGFKAGQDEAMATFHELLGEKT